MDKKCSLCGRNDYITVFKSGFVCEDCLKVMKAFDEVAVSLPSPSDEPVVSLHNHCPSSTAGPKDR